jgi:hypothetical protein
MSPEETRLLTALFDRVRTASSTPRDSDAEILIERAVRDQPTAPYYLAQAVIVQEKGLEAAATHIARLEERIHQLESGNADPHHTQQGGFLSSIFGSSQPQATAPAPAAAPPTTNYRNDTADPTAGPWGRAQSQQPQAQQPTGPWSPQPVARSASGSFLQGALGTAAGVAGGMLLANSLSGIFGNHMSSLGLGSPVSGNTPVEETVVNNYYGNDTPDQTAGSDNNGTEIQQADDDSDNDDDSSDMDFDSGDDGSFA